MKKPKYPLYFDIFLIIVLGLAVYANALHGPFLNDDFKHVVDNETIRDATNVGALWHAFNTRFIPGWSFAINYALGGLSTFGYHLFNVAGHILAAGLLFQMLKKLLRASRFEALQGKSRMLSLTAALIFLTHPIQTQAVAYISQRFVILASIFYFSAMICYLNWRKNKKPLNYILALMFVGLGCVSKENTATIFFALVLCEWILLKPQKNNLAVWPFLLAPVLIGCILVFNADDSATRIKQAVAVSAFDMNYVLTELNVLRTYWSLLFIPLKQAFSYDYPIARGLLEGKVWVSLLFHGVLIYLAGRMRKRWPLVSFGIFWFYIHTSVEAASVAFGNRGVIYENWLYLPMAGFAVLLAESIGLIFQNEKYRAAICVALILGLSFLTWNRNWVYQDSVVFWRDIATKQPAPYHKIEYALVLEEAGHLQEAEDYLRRFMSQMPDHLPTYANLGNLLAKQERYEEAEKVFQRGLTVFYNYHGIHHNMGVMYYNMGQYDLAVLSLDYADRLYPIDRRPRELLVRIIRKTSAEQVQKWLENNRLQTPWEMD